MHKETIWRIFCVLLCLSILLTGCSKKHNVKESIDEDIFNRENSNGGQQQQVDYAFPYGPKNEENPVEIYEDRLEYDMYIDNQGKAAEFGVMIVIDGIPQKTVLPGNDNTPAIMHKVSLKTKEAKDYKFIMNKELLNIDKGDDHIIYPVLILEPDFIPERRNYFGHEGRLSAARGIPFTYANDRKQDMKIGYVEPVKIDDKFRSEYNIDKGEELYGEIFWSLEDINNVFISAEDLKKGFDINLAGDVPAAEMRVFLFVNNKPVEMNGYSFYEAKVQKGMVAKIHVDPTDEFIAGLKNNDLIYALAMPKNLDSFEFWPVKTKTAVIKGTNNE